MRISAAVAREAGAPFHLEHVELVDPRADEVVVRVVAVGICHTDVAARDQSLPIALPAVLGHEGAGVVEKVGAAVTKLAPGDKVVLTVASCGECVNCRRGDVAYCESNIALNYGGSRPDGSPTLCSGGLPVSGHFFGQSSFATYALANERNAIKVHRDADLTIAAPLGCGVQTGAGTVLRALDAKEGRSIAIFGGGSVGLSAAMAAKFRGCTPIIVVEPVAARRTLAIELGATHAIDPAEGELAGQIRGIVARGVDYVIDTTAAVPVIEAALAALATHGAVALLGVPKDPSAALRLSLLELLVAGATIKGVVEGDTDPDAFIPELLEHVEAGRMPLGRLVRHYPFAQINQAIDDQLSGVVVKPVLLLEA